MIAVVFPGQGSQSVGMLSVLNDHRELIDPCFDVASTVLGYDLYDLIQSGPAEKLNQTVYTQPAMLVSDIAMWRVLHGKFGVQPVLLAGHSLGEYAALVASEVLSLEDGVRLVQERARLMQEAVPEGVGAMGVIVGLSDEQVQTLCDEVSNDETAAMPANFNSPGQIVIAGNIEVVDLALVKAKEMGAKIAKKLPMSVPSHCHLMKKAAEKFETALNAASFQSPQIPVIQNADLQIHATADEIKIALKQQLFLPVRWIETVNMMVNKNIDTIIECGPGKVLTGLNKRIHSTLSLKTFLQAVEA